jgi:cell division transport system ATP-binding protein
VIHLSHVSKFYKASTRPALDDVSIDVEKGEFAFVIGPSGSGKSTFLRLLIREDIPTSGTVEVDGQDLVHLRRSKVAAHRRRLGCVFQDFRLLTNKTVEQNVGFALEVIGRSRASIKQVVPEVLEMVGLEGKANRLPHELSGGEQQRVAIARAFANRPLLLLADEPTGNLDRATANGVFDLMLDLTRRPGMAFVLVTHDESLAARCDRRLHLAQGRLVV